MLCFGKNRSSNHHRVCVYVCVFITLTDQAPNLSEKTKCGCRADPDRRKKEKQKGAAPGYKMQKRVRKQFPQKAKSEMSNPVGKDKAK